MPRQAVKKWHLLLANIVGYIDLRYTREKVGGKIGWYIDISKLFCCLASSGAAKPVPSTFRMADSPWREKMFVCTGWIEICLSKAGTFPRTSEYCMSKKSWPNLYSNLLYKMSQDFSDRQNYFYMDGLLSNFIRPCSCLVGQMVSQDMECSGVGK